MESEMRHHILGRYRFSRIYALFRALRPTVTKGLLPRTKRKSPLSILRCLNRAGIDLPYQMYAPFQLLPPLFLSLLSCLLITAQGFR